MKSSETPQQDAALAATDQTAGQFTTVKLQAALDAQVNPEVVSRRQLAQRLASMGARISEHGVEAWFRRVDSNYGHPRRSLSDTQPSFAVPGRHWALLLDVFALTPDAIELDDVAFTRHVRGLAPGRDNLLALEQSSPEHLPGRESALAELILELEASEESGARMVLIEGQAGHGKTSLVEELIRRTRASNRLCITASCVENSYIPLLPLLDLVRLQRDEVVQGGAEAVRLAQELLLRIELANEKTDQAPNAADAAEVSALHATDARSSLFLLGSDLLVELARHAPLLVVVDDVHWLDATTRDLLLHFARFLRLNRHHRVLLVLAGRQFSRSFLHQLPTGDFRRQMTLAPLDRNAARRAANRLLGADLNQAARDFVWNITQGNPLYVAQLCEHLRSSAQLQERNGQLALSGPSDAIHVPETLDDFYRQRFDQLDDTAAELLQVAACFGQLVNPQLTAMLRPDLEPEQQDQALSRAEAVGLIQFSAHGYEFCHPVARHSVYVAMSDAQRSRQHAQIAQAIERSMPDPTPHARIELAYHLVRGLPFTDDKAVMSACREAASHSHQLAAWPSSEFFVTQALELDDRLSTTDEGLNHEQRGVLLRLRGSSRHQTAQPVVALQDLGDALERFERAQNTVEYTRTLSQIVRIRSNFAEVREGHDQAADELAEYAQVLVESDGEVAAQALEVLASYRLANNDSRAARRLAQQALDTFSASASGLEVNEAVLTQITAGLACLNELDAHGALGYLVEATRLARACSATTLQRCLQRLVVAQLVLGRIDEVFATHEELRSLAGSTLTGEHTAVSCAVSAALSARGEYSAALATAKEGLELLDVSGYRFMETALVGNQVYALVMQGDFDTALQAVARLETDRPRRAAELLRCSIERARRGGESDSLAEHLRRSAQSEHAPDVGELARVMMLAEVALASGDAEVVLAVLPKLRAAEESGVLFATAWPELLPLLLARLYLMLDRERDAHHYFMSSLKFARAGGLLAVLQQMQTVLSIHWPEEQALLEDVNRAIESQASTRDA